MNEKITDDSASTNSASAIQSLKMEKITGPIVTGASSGSNSPIQSEDCSKEMVALKAISSPDRMTILHLINDCLENIFKRLPLEDLINVSESSLTLKTIACSIFQRKYGKTFIIIFTKPPSIFVREKIFEGATPIRTILKNFGSSINKLCLNYDLNSHHLNKFVDEAIVSYCAESLTELRINNCHSKLMANLNETFLNIRIVKFMHGQLGDEISRIHKIFPKIEHLILRTAVSLNRIQYNFRALTVLKVCSPTLTTESISIFISLNAQLQVLKLEHNNNLRLNASFLRFISEKLLSLEVLGLSYPIDSWTDGVPNENCEQENVELNSLKKVTVDVGSADILQNIPLQFANLLELKITVLRNPSSKLIDFLKQAVGIKTLTLRIYERNSFRIDSQYMFRFAKNFPNLRHIFLYTPDVITSMHIVRDRDIEPIENKYLTKDDHTPFLLANRVISTKYLIQYSTYPIVHVATSYKITRDFPVTLFGVTGLHGRFVLIGLAMTDDYDFIFNTIKNTLPNFKPEVLVSNAKGEIEMAARKVFGELTSRTAPADNNCLLSVLSNARSKLDSAVIYPVSVLREYMEQYSRAYQHKMNQH